VTAAVEMDQKTATMRFWYVVTAVVGLLAAFKGSRLPNRWAATQAQLDYSQGFVKRGFFGAAIAGPLGLGHYARFAVVSYGLLTVLAVMLVMLALKSGVAERLGGAELLAVFFGSYGVSTLANTAGYLDVPLAMIAVGILFVRKPMLRIGLGLPLTVVALLIHELFLFVFLPVLLLSFVLQGLSETTAAGKLRVLAAGLLLALVAGGLGLRLAHEEPMSPAQATAMSEHVAQRVDFEPRQDFYTVLVLSSKDNLSTMTGYFKSFDWYVKQLASVMVFGPSVFLLLAAAASVVKSSIVGVNAWVVAAVVICGLSPLAMHVFAWDVARFNGLVCLTAFLALIVAVRFTTGPALVTSLRQRQMVAMVLLLSMASGGLLMWRTDKMFPAYPELKKFKNQMQGMTLAQIADLSD